MSVMTPRHTIGSALLAFVLVAALIAGPGGCVGYNTYPPVPGQRAFTHPNSPAVHQLMSESLRWVVRRYPPDGEPGMLQPEVEYDEPRLVINLPEGILRNVYLRVARNVGQGAVPVTPETEHLPTYHVAQLWVRGDRAKVDVLRPVPGLVMRDGEQVHQGITVHLRGGPRPWRVTTHRVWTIGAMETPPLTYLPPETPPEPEPEPEPDPPADPEPVDPANDDDPSDGDDAGESADGDGAGDGQRAPG